MVRNPIRDQVAIVGLGTTGFSRDSGGRSSKALACEASINAIRDAGLTAADINGIVGAAEPGGPALPQDPLVQFRIVLTLIPVQIDE